MMPAATGFTVWITGMSGAGKTTLGRRLFEHASANGRRAELLDGDEIRKALGPDLGYAPADRRENIRRIAFVADLLSHHGVMTIVATISPFADARAEARRRSRAPFVEVFLDCPIETLRQRDPKGLYSKADAGVVADFTGVSSPYEPPADPDVYIRTDLVGANEALHLLCRHLADKGLFTPPYPPASVPDGDAGI
jgi:adenylylsulfate kinase